MLNIHQSESRQGHSFILLSFILFSFLFHLSSKSSPSFVNPVFFSFCPKNEKQMSTCSSRIYTHSQCVFPPPRRCCTCGAAASQSHQGDLHSALRWLVKPHLTFRSTSQSANLNAAILCTFVSLFVCFYSD